MMNGNRRGWSEDWWSGGSGYQGVQNLLRARRSGCLDWFSWWSFGHD